MGRASPMRYREPPSAVVTSNSRRSVRSSVIDRFDHGRGSMRAGNQLLKVGWIFRAAAFRLREYELAGVRPEDRDHFFKLLVGHYSENDPHAFRMELSKKCRERTRCSHIVRAVQKESAATLQPARPRCGVDSANNILFRDSQTLGCSNRNSNIFELVTPEELRPQFGVTAEIGAAHEPISRSLANDRQIRGWPDNHRLARLNDAGFFGGDGFDRSSQKLLMIQANARDDRDVLIDDIRRIQPSSQTHFEDGEPDAIAKVEKSHRRNQLEGGRWIEQIFRR